MFAFYAWQNKHFKDYRQNSRSLTQNKLNTVSRHSVTVRCSTATVTSNPRCITTTATSTSTTIFICTKILFISYCKKTLIIKLEYWLLWITIGDRAARQHTCKWNCRESTVLETCPLLFLYINSFLPVILQFALERKILLCQLLLQCFNISIKIRGKFIKKKSTLVLSFSPME